MASSIGDFYQTRTISWTMHPPSVRLFVCLSVCPCPSAHLPICPSVCVCVCLSVRPSLYLSVCPSVCPLVCLSVRLSVPKVSTKFQINPTWHGWENPFQTSICLSVCLSVHLSVCLSVRPEGLQQVSDESDSTRLRKSISNVLGMNRPTDRSTDQSTDRKVSCNRRKQKWKTISRLKSSNLWVKCFVFIEAAV